MENRKSVLGAIHHLVFIDGEQSIINKNYLTPASTFDPVKLSAERRALV